MGAMGRRAFLAAAGAALARRPGAEPAPAEPACYRPGQAVDEGVFVLDAALRPVALRALLRDPLTLLFVFGGANRRSPAGIWCEDSESDLRLLRSLKGRFAPRGVAFVLVAVPPVYSEARSGYAEGAFLGLPDDAPAYRSAVEAFVTATEGLRREGAIPFEELHYDPRFRLLDNPRMGAHTPGYGVVHDWQGRFKWWEDEQRHGTPTLWLLAGDGRVLREPFWGNVYHGRDRRIRYEEPDVAQALEERLKAVEAR